MAEEAKASVAVQRADIEARLPALVPGSAAEKLAHVALQGLDRLDEITRIRVDETSDPKLMRTVGDMAVAANRLFMRAAESEFRARKDDVLERLLAALSEPASKIIDSE